MDTIVQPKITGYRQLAPEEAALMNEIKALGTQIENVHARVAMHIGNLRREAFAAPLLATEQEKTRIDDLRNRLEYTQPERWAQIAKTDLQTGLMALTRAVAQPTSF